MDQDDQHSAKTGSISNIRVSPALTLRDMIYVGIAIVTITAAWGLYDTRLSLVEQKLISIDTHLTEIKQEIKEIQNSGLSTRESIDSDVGALEQRVRVLEDHKSHLRGVLDGQRNKSRK